MKKYLWIFLILGLVLGIIIFDFSRNNNEKDGYIAQRTGTNVDNISEDDNANETNEINNKEKNTEEISSFSTRLPNDTKSRDHNIKLACKTLNETVIKSGETFSFWDSLGCPTKEKGYKEAKTFTSNGEVTQSYGGGVCQISTTIYNAILKVDGLKITERHEHSREVPYIEDGKDAAVSYNTADLKFKSKEGIRY